MKYFFYLIALSFFLVPGNTIGQTQADAIATISNVYSDSISTYSVSYFYYANGVRYDKVRKISFSKPFEDYGRHDFIPGEKFKMNYDIHNPDLNVVFFEDPVFTSEEYIGFTKGRLISIEGNHCKFTYNIDSTSDVWFIKLQMLAPHQKHDLILEKHYKVLYSLNDPERSIINLDQPIEDPAVHFQYYDLAKEKKPKKNEFLDNFGGIDLMFTSLHYNKILQSLDVIYHSPTSSFGFKEHINFRHVGQILVFAFGGDFNFNNRIHFNFRVGVKPGTYTIAGLFSGGLGYVFPLSKNNRFLLRPHIDLAYNSINYSTFTNILDTIDTQIIMKKYSLGNRIVKIDYFNSTLNLSPTLDLICQSPGNKYLISIGYLKTISSNEGLTFQGNRTLHSGKNYSPATSSFYLKNNSLLFNSQGQVVHKGVISLSTLFFSFGIIGSF
jgi:hypothetical protein